MTDETTRERPRFGLDHPTVVPRNFEERSGGDRDGRRPGRQTERTKD